MLRSLRWNRQKARCSQAGKAAPHKIQGIGAGFVPKILKRELIDEVMQISAQEAYHAACMLAKEEGVLCGVSSGAALSGLEACRAAGKCREKDSSYSSGHGRAISFHRFVFWRISIE